MKSPKMAASLWGVVCLLLTGLFPGTAPAQDTRLVRETEPLSPEEEEAALHVPEGFQISLFAAEPMINKPINLAFDERGRLWVSSTVEYPYAAAKERWSDERGTRIAGSRDAIKILEDTDGDGRADRVTDFADGLNIPTGVLPWHKAEHAAGCIAWSIPNIWYFADTDGDGICDSRKVLFGPLGWEKDTHGMCSSFRLGPGGEWVYATHGFNNTSHFEAKDGSTLDLQSGNVFRFRPDGSHVEIWSWGQVNPFGLAFDRRGNLYSADCHSAPVYQLLRGAYYPSFGKPHDGLGFGPAMIEHTHGSTGICGIVYLDRGVWGAEWDDRVLIGNPVTSRINHDILEYRGTTPHAVEQPDFVVSGDPWFRPVDLRLGPDGALYVADFYNRIIGHYEVPLDHPGRDRERGRIWRIVKKDRPAGAPVPAAPKVTPLENPVAALAEAGTSPFVIRQAAAQLQEAPDPDALGPLLQALLDCPEADTHLHHALRLSLREHFRLPEAFSLYKGLLSESYLPAGTRDLVVSIALGVPTEASAVFLWETLSTEEGTASPPLETVRHIVREGPEQVVAETVAWCRERVAPRSQLAYLRGLHEALAERGTAPPPAWIDWANAEAVRLLGAAESSGWTVLPDAASPASPWVLQARACADGTEAEVISSLAKGERGAEQRTGSLISKPFAAPPALSFWICGHRGSPKEPAHEKNRVELAEAASGEVLRQAFPPRSDVCQPVHWNLSDLNGRDVVLRIVDGDNGRAFAWLGVTRIEPEVAAVASFQPEASADLSFLARALGGEGTDTRLQAYLPKKGPAVVVPARPEGIEALLARRLAAYAAAKPDSTRGAEIFSAQCAACHQIEGAGGLVGPQLDGIGARGAERLIEDILDPNRNVDVNFQVHALSLRGGGAQMGFVRGEAGEALVLVDATGQETRVAKSEIVKNETLPLSLMPAVFGQTLPEQDFYDLLGWLLAKTQPAKP